jgi:hypothetical protein
MKKPLCYLLTGIGIILVFACGRSKNAGIIGIDSMKVVMWDMMKADELYMRMTVKDTALYHSKERIRLYKEVFALHHITRGQFDSSYKFYASHPQQFKILADSLDLYATREKNKIFNNHGQAH